MYPHPTEILLMTIMSSLHVNAMRPTLHLLQAIWSHVLYIYLQDFAYAIAWVCIFRMLYTCVLHIYSLFCAEKTGNGLCTNKSLEHGIQLGNEFSTCSRQRSSKAHRLLSVTSAARVNTAMCSPPVSSVCHTWVYTHVVMRTSASMGRGNCSPDQDVNKLEPAFSASK